jgi:hypothetical protein
MMIRGRLMRAHLITTHARQRSFESFGFAFFALLNCVQSGENHANPTGRSPQSSRGSMAHTSSAKCAVCG